LVADESELFWVSGTNIFAASIVDGGGSRLVTTAPQFVSSIAVVDNDVYIAAANGASPGSDHSQDGIYHALKSWSGVPATPLAHQTLGYYTDIAADSTYVYYTVSTSDDYSHGTVWRMRRNPGSIPSNGFDAGAPGGPELLFTDQSGVEGIRVDDRYLYWVNSDEYRGGLMRALK